MSIQILKGNTKKTIFLNTKDKNQKKGSIAIKVN